MPYQVLKLSVQIVKNMLPFLMMHFTFQISKYKQTHLEYKRAYLALYVIVLNRKNHTEICDYKI